MKDFLEKLRDTATEDGALDQIKPQARLAVYDSAMSAPRLEDVSASGCEEFVGLLASRVYRHSQEKGGSVPFTVIREVIENLIHACFAGVTVSILDGGNTIRISDRGPGVGDKEKAFEPGFSTATPAMRRFVRGVGSGLPIVRESLRLLGGAVTIEDNLARGTVVTLNLPPVERPVEHKIAEPQASPEQAALTKRQKQVLSLVMELGSVGPSTVAAELAVGLSTAYRDLLALQERGLVAADKQGKRGLTAAGIGRLDALLNP